MKPGERIKELAKKADVRVSTCDMAHIVVALIQYLDEEYDKVHKPCCK